MRNELIIETEKLPLIKVLLLVNILATHKITDLSNLAFIFNAKTWAESWVKVTNPDQYSKNKLKELLADTYYQKIHTQLKENKNIGPGNRPHHGEIDYENSLLIYFLIHSINCHKDINYHHASFFNITLLHIIASLENHKLLKLALSIHADQKIGGSKELFPLYYSAMRGDQKAVEIMLKDLSKSNETLLQEIINQPHPMPQKKLFYNLFICAIFSGNLELVKYLLKKGAKIDLKGAENNGGILNLIEVAFLNAKDNLDIINFLLDRLGLSFETLVSREAKYFSFSPIILAAVSGNKNLFEKLLSLTAGDLPILSVQEYLKLKNAVSHFHRHVNPSDVKMDYISECFNKKVDLFFIINNMMPYSESKKSNQTSMKQSLKNYLSDKVLTLSNGISL